MNKRRWITPTVYMMLVCFAAVSCSQKKETLSRDPHQPYNYQSEHGMVVAAHPLAAEAGVSLMKQGGNAVDAAVAAAFALNVVEPFASGIGGGGFMVIYSAESKQVSVINFRETAPSGAAPDMYIENGEINDHWRTDHGLAVAVPGALAGWTHALDTYGTLDLKKVTEPGIALADQGFTISPVFSRINKDEYEKILMNDGVNSPYLHDGFAYEPGDTFTNPDLAATFRLIAEKGPDVFYKGEIAQKIIDAVREKGGIMTLEDLGAYQTLETAPLTGKYKSYSLFTAPPPACGGLHVIQLLNIISHWPVHEWGGGSAAFIHHLGEALRFVFADRARYLGDPKFVDIPIEELTSPEYAQKTADRIQAESISGYYPPAAFHPREMDKENTTHLCAVDRQGNIVSLTQSINLFFGTGIVPENTGFILNNHMNDFTPQPGNPNSPEPGKQPRSNMAPLILFKNNQPFLALGSPGGARIFPSLTQILVHIIEFNLSLDEAIEAPRFFTYSSEGKPEPLYLESRFPQSALDHLKSLGNDIIIREAYDNYFGGAQGLMFPPGRNIILGGADSRRDGGGAGY